MAIHVVVHAKFLFNKCQKSCGFQAISAKSKLSSRPWFPDCLRDSRLTLLLSGDCRFIQIYGIISDEKMLVDIK